MNESGTCLAAYSCMIIAINSIAMSLLIKTDKRYENEKNAEIWMGAERIIRKLIGCSN